ncbi:unnamed protein product [Cercospora beticola]|nr:unnamed protein product [Cercospora beticola]
MPLFFSRSRNKALVAPKDKIRISKIEVSKNVRHPATPSQPLINYDLQPKSTLHYQQLDHQRMEIRLLQILPGRSDELIRCAIIYTALREKPYLQYETISYCWGTSKQKKAIEVNGLLIDVGINAYYAMRRVRSPNVARVIWIDQICIDQNFIPERNQQVANMSNVYLCARQNLVWLDQDHGEAAAVQASLKAVLANIRLESKDFTKFYEMLHRSNGMFRRDGRCLDARVDLRPLKLLFSSPWFGRLWIVQEVAMGRWNICHFGSADIVLRDVLRVGVWMLYNTACLPDDIADMPSLTQALSLWYLTDEVIPDKRYRKITQSLPQARAILQNFECTNPHDNVYGLLGLFSVGQPMYGKTLAALRPAYEKPVEVVFRDATRAIIEDSGHADILQSGLMKVSDQGVAVPSWVVNFHERPHTANGPSPFGQHFAAHGSILYSEDDWNGHPDILRLRGVWLTSVQARTRPLTDATNKTACLFFRDAYELLLSATKGTSRERSIEMCSIFTAGSNWLRQPLSKEDFDDFGSWIRNLRIDRGATAGFADLEATHFAKAVMRACHRRRFFVTHNGLLGIGPKDMDEHDLIVVIFGSSVPLVLRDAGRGRYKLLGGCYVYGIMKGEAVHQHRTAGKPDRVFDLI